jgi:hypothetical protein
MRTLRRYALALGLILTACDGLADESSTGKRLARLSGTMTGTMPDEPLRLAAVWKQAGGYTLGAGECAAWESDAVTEQIVQEVDGSLIEGNRFEVDFEAAPPDDAFYPGHDDGDWDDPEHPERSIPFEYAIGVLIAYADRNGNGRLDRCDGPSCTDRVMGTSNGDGAFVPFGQSVDGAASTELGVDDYLALPDAYQDTASSILFTTEPWRPYGAREIPAGYVVQRLTADVADGQRFFDGFDPSMDVEIPLVGSPILDGFACDGGCIGSFVHGEAECPDAETGWCSLAPEMPPADAELRGVQCRPVNDENQPYREMCNPVWSRVTWGCDRFAELWLGCEVAGPDSAPDLTWSCLE